jgi:hypothetical protein
MTTPVSASPASRSFLKGYIKDAQRPDFNDRINDSMARAENLIKAHNAAKAGRSLSTGNPPTTQSKILNGFKKEGSPTIVEIPPTPIKKNSDFMENFGIVTNESGDISPSSDSSTLLSPSPKSSLCSALVLNNAQSGVTVQPYNTTNTLQEYPYNSELSTASVLHSTPTDAAAITSSSTSSIVNNSTTTFERRTSSTTSSSAASASSSGSPSSRFGAMTGGASAFGPPGGSSGGGVSMSLVPNNNNRMINLQNANTDHSAAAQ